MNNVGVIVLATGPYTALVPAMIDSVRKYFLKNIANITPFILTDAKTELSGIRCHVEHRKWPGVNMHRYHSILQHSKQYEGQNYLFNFDADLIVKQPIGTEILAETVGLISPTAWRWPVDKFLYERRPQSSAYIPSRKGKYFYNASISGGLANPYLAMLERITAMINTDEQNGISPPWCHEETYLNREFLDRPPTLSLTPDYCWPMGTHSLQRDFAQPRISMLNKNRTLDKFKL